MKIAHIPLRDEELLDLNYLKEISEGNTEFENSMIEQFLQQVPGELESMKEAFQKERTIRNWRILHTI